MRENTNTTKLRPKHYIIPTIDNRFFLRILGVLKYLGLLFELYIICYYVKHVFALHSPPTIT